MRNDRIGNVAWVMDLTGFSKATVIRLVHCKVLPGYQAFAGKRGSPILFNKSRVKTWFDALTYQN